MTKLSLLIGLSFPQISAAGTTTEDVLKWQRSEQVSFLQISISMVAVVASQTKPEIARCLDDWYFESKAKQDQRHNEIIQLMPDYTEFDPSALVLGYLESVCGEFPRPRS